MASADIELDSVEWLSTGTVGPPGKRVFYIQARQGSERVTLQVEKAHVLNIAERVGELLTDLELLPRAAGDMELSEPIQANWTVGEVGLGYVTERSQFVLVARELTSESDRPPRLARLWLSPALAHAFAERARQVVAGGRPVCGRCGFPIDVSGHPCPALNGSRPISQ